jgi:hypothetical protein
MLSRSQLSRGVVGALAAAALLAVTPVAAQPRGPGGGPGWGPGGGWGPGMMMGPGMMGGGWGRMCDPRAAGLAEWRVERIERVVKPAEAQRKGLDDLKTASTKAGEIVAAACPKEFPASPTARLELMEKRMDAMLQAIKTVRPAFDTFYASLDDEQKARLTSAGPRNWGWRDWRWRDRD